ncbi:MAG TPA: DUF4337 domain-containing protein [Azospirillum sp.]|nr:DUF4337 domain-containing protein [Azospirillum sp.]
MSEAFEHHEKAHEAAHGSHSSNRRIGLMIAALAALLAISEAAGKSAQTEALNRNVEAANLWAFFQAKTIRMTTMRTAAEEVKLQITPDLPDERRATLQKQVDTWNQTAQRYDTEPETQEGRRELAARAKQAEAIRDTSLSAYHMFEYGSAAFQLAIVLASATVITGFLPLAWLSAGLGVLGTAITVIGWLAPTALHLGGH